MPDLFPGLFANNENIVSDGDTASHWGSGGLKVFSTPALVGLMESTAVMALTGNLPPGQTTVGGHIDVRHLAATPIGMKVRAHAELIAVEGRRLIFKIQAWDEVELIGEASHDRFVVDADRFMSKVVEKSLKSR